MRSTIFWTFIIFSLSACGIFTSAPEKTRRPTTPNKPEKEKTEEVVKEEEKEEEVKDTLIAVEEDTLLTPEIEETTFERKKQYNLKIMIPVMPEEMEEEAEVREKGEEEEKEKKLSNWNKSFIDYLAGFKFGLENALDSLPSLSYRLSIESSGDMDQHIVESDSLFLKSTDVLIGGVTNESLEKMNTWAAQTENIFISPWVPFRPLAQNIQFIQLTPDLQTHCEVIAGYVDSNYKNSPIFIAVSEKNQKRSECISSAFEPNLDTSRVQTLILSQEYLQKEEFELEEFGQLFHKADTNILLIPEDRNKGFIHSLISKLTLLEDYNFKIFGLQGWLNYSLLHDYFEKMPFYISVDQFIPRGTSAYHQFEKVYYDQYANLPSDWSVKGYDHAVFIANGLSEYGKDLPENIHSMQFRGLGTHFIFAPTAVEQSEEENLYHNVNRGVQIIEYEQHQFQNTRE